MTAPVLVRLPHLPRLLDPIALGKLLDKALDQIRKAHTAGLTVTIVSPDARTIQGRKRIAEALRHAGLEPEIVSLLGWDTTYPGAEPPAPQDALPAADPEIDPPTLTDDPIE